MVNKTIISPVITTFSSRYYYFLDFTSHCPLRAFFTATLAFSTFLGRTLASGPHCLSPSTGLTSPGLCSEVASSERIAPHLALSLPGFAALHCTYYCLTFDHGCIFKFTGLVSTLEDKLHIGRSLPNLFTAVFQSLEGSLPCNRHSKNIC